MIDKHNDGNDKFERDSQKETQIRRETRKQRAIERLGTHNPRCIHCDESDPLVLEKHHVAGRDYDDSTVILCRNCHRKLSDLQKDHPKKNTENPDPLESIAHFLLGVAELFELLIIKCREFATYLIELANSNRDNLELQR